MFSEINATRIKTRALCFWSITLSAVLAVTLLQVAPPARAVSDPNLFIDLVTRADGVGQSAVLGESSILGAQESAIYRLDLQVDCGLLDYIDDNSNQVVYNIMGQQVVWTSQGISVALVGTASELDRVLDNLQIVQAPADFGPPAECGASTIQAWLVLSDSWSGNYDPQGQAGYYLATPSPIPVMFDLDEDQAVTTPRLLPRSDGFEVEWNEYLGAPGFTPSGFTVRYRDVTNSGTWVYEKVPSGENISASISGLSGSQSTYEFQVAPTVQNCDGATVFGLFSNMANRLSQSPIDSNASPVGDTRTTGHAVASQCTNDPVISTTSLPSGNVNSSYSQTVAASGRNALTYALAEAGTLPAGLSLNTDTGVISGTPTQAGNFTFSVTATDQVNSLQDSQSLTILIEAELPTGPTALGCENYSSFVPENFILDSNGYPIGCDLTGQESVTPAIEDNPVTEDVVESWTQKFDTRADLDFFNLRNGWKCDDCSIGLNGDVNNEGPPGSGSSSNSAGLPLGFSFNYYGETYDSVFVNSNGSLTLGAPSTCYNQTLTQIMRCGEASGTSAIVAYGVDLDNSNLNPDVWGGPGRHTDFFYWGKTTIDGKQAFVASWMNSPGYCEDTSEEFSDFNYSFDTCDPNGFNSSSADTSYEDTLSTFQIVIVDQSTAEDGVSGDADVIINYGPMQDSQQGYGSCDILRGENAQDTEFCENTADRYLAAGLGSTSVDPENSELWNSSVTSLEALDGAGPGTILYNGIDASQVGDGGSFALSSARQNAESTPGQFIYAFRSGDNPDVATAPSAPLVSLGSPSESSIIVTIEPPTDNGGTPVLTYSIEYRIIGETNWVSFPTAVQFAEPSTTQVIGNLTPNTSYEVRVVANNGIGNSNPSEVDLLSTSPVSGVPETPSFISENPISPQDLGWVRYTWEALSNDPESYSIRYRPTIQSSGTTYPWVTSTYTGDNGFNGRQGDTPILNPNTEYEFQISAQNQAGSSSWSTSSTVTTSLISKRRIDVQGVQWNGYGSEISSATNSTSGMVYDGALKVFIGDSFNSAVQVTCDQSSVNLPGFDFGVEGKQGHYEWETSETRVQGGYSVVCEPIALTLGSGEDVFVSLSRFFFTDSPWTRVMVDITNTEQTELTTSVWLQSDLQDGDSGNTTYEATSTQVNPTSPAVGDQWVVTGDNKSNGMVVAHVFSDSLVDSNVSSGVNQDGSDLMVSEFALDVPGSLDTQANTKKISWFDGIVQYEQTLDPADLSANYLGAVATAKAAAENFTKVKSQQTDTYPRFIPPSLTNFRMSEQIEVTPGIHYPLRGAKISGLDVSDTDLKLEISGGYVGGYLPVVFKVDQAASTCIDNSLNVDVFLENTALVTEVLTIRGSQQELNCFLEGLTFSFPNTPPDSNGLLYAELSDSSQAVLSAQATTLVFEGSANSNQTLFDVEAGYATWRGVGTGINDVETRSNRNAYDEGSLKAYWIPNVNADPLVDGIEIVCPRDAEDTSFLDNSQVKVLTCATDDVETPGGPLSILISRNFATSDPWQQLELNIVNNGEADIRGALAYRLDLGSDENTEIEMTSDGDLNLESADSWFITSDDGMRTDPVLLHYVGYETGQKITRGSDVNADKIWVKTPLEVNSGIQVKKRYLEGVVDTPRGQTSDSVVIAMKAADDVSNNMFDVPSGDNFNILNISMSDAVLYDRDLPPLHAVYECRDYAKNALGPIRVQPDGKAIGCDMGFDFSGSGPGFPGGGSGLLPLNYGLFPGGQSLDQDELAFDWSETFSSTFPNAEPRLGWACDDCIVTREGVVTDTSTPELPAGIPLGFTSNLFTGSESYDSIRILPQGLVQVHESSDTNSLNGNIISAFGNAAMSNGVLQGNWSELPEYDFFYWGRTLYQGRVAFVITWVKIPTVEYINSDALGAQSGAPISGLEPTSVQLMLVSDSTQNDFSTYITADPSEREVSDVDIIWNFDSIQGEQAHSVMNTGEPNPQPLFTGTYSFGLSGDYTTLTSDEAIETEEFIQIGIGGDSCNATCVATELLSNKFQSPINGRYVMGFRDYQFTEDPEGPLPERIPGFVAPAAPRAVEVLRQQADVAQVSWKAPKPWVISQFNSISGPLAGASPVLGYRIEYTGNGRGEDQYSENEVDVYPALNQPPLQLSDLIPSTDGNETRYSVVIEDLQMGQQYTFRVYATYTGLDVPEPQTDLVFTNEIRGVPSLANEQHVSELEISPVGLQGNPMAPVAQVIAAQLAGDLTVSNATINGSEFAHGITDKSIATFTGGTDSVGFDQGLVISPLVDARTFERGSGITYTDSDSAKLSKFVLPQERATYEEIFSDFERYMQTQESWVPASPGAYQPVCDNLEGPSDTCVNGMTVLQFDVTPTADFLKFEYALAGTETGEFLYGFPDGFGLFVGGIDQSNSCALVPQVNDTSPEERFLTTANAFEARLASYVPWNSDLHAATITSTMTCSSDVSSYAESETPVTVTMIIANADDQVLSPAVFLKGNSVRFEATSIEARDIPAGMISQSYEPVQLSTTGTAPTSWSATGLPDGMQLTTDGELRGLPIESGNFNFTVTAEGENNVVLATQAFTILINADESARSVQNLKVNIDDGKISWTEPLNSEPGITYDVYFGILGEPRTLLIGGAPGDPHTEISQVTGTTYFFDSQANGRWRSDLDYVFTVAANWPNQDSFESSTLATYQRNICPGQISCPLQGDNVVTNPSWQGVADGIVDATSAQGNGDAFDDGLEVFIGNGASEEEFQIVRCDYSTIDLDINQESDITGYSVECVPSDLTMSGLEDISVVVHRYFFADNQWTRTMATVENNGSEPFAGSIRLSTDLGSDGNTNIVASSTNPGTTDPNFYGTDDSWIVTSDGSNRNDPVIIHMLGAITKPVDHSETCWREIDNDEIQIPENSDGCEDLTTDYSLAIDPGESYSQAWFTGLVGYEEGFQPAAIDKAIAAAQAFQQASINWTGSMVGVETPSLMHEIPRFDCQSLGPRAEGGDRELNVLMLAKHVALSSEENNSTLYDADIEIGSSLCGSGHMRTVFFDGGDGSADAWESALQNIDVIVLPETSYRLVDSDLLSIEALGSLKSWIEEGGRIVFTSGSSYSNEIALLLGLEIGDINFDSKNLSSVSSGNRPDAMPEQLPIEEDARSANLLQIDNQFYESVVVGRNVEYEDIYTSIEIGDNSYVANSAFTEFRIQRGMMHQLSSNYRGETSSSWNKALLQAVYGTPSRSLDVTEAGKRWGINNVGVYWDEMSSASSLKLGQNDESQSIKCLNTPSSPAIRKVTTGGTEISCGTYLVNDGIVDSGLEVKLKRFFSSSSPWMGTTVKFKNLDTDNTYDNFYTFGGASGQGSATTIEATSDRENGTSNLSEWSEELGSIRAKWLVTSRGNQVSHDAGDYNSAVVMQAYGQEPFASYGGSDRPADLYMRDDDVYSLFFLGLTPEESKSISFFTGLVDFSPGCDRMAVDVAKYAANSLNAQFDTELNEDSWPHPSEVSFPSLSTSTCSSYTGSLESLAVAQDYENVAVTWPKVLDASSYEVESRISGSSDWDNPITVISSGSAQERHDFPSLRDGIEYEFRVRPIQTFRNSSGDKANGTWSEAVRITAAAVPQPSSSASPSSSQSPSVNNSGPDLSATIVPQMVAQAGPGFPARLKKGKTVKFGMTAPSGLPLRVSSVGRCKTTAITKKVTVKVLVGKKIKKKKVKVQTGWAVKGTKKGLCTVTFSNSGDATRSPLAAAGTITVF